MRESRKFCQRGSNFDIFFKLMSGERIEIPLKRAIIARQRNAIAMAFCRRTDDGPLVNAGLLAL